MVLDYWNGSVAYLDVGDFTNTRRRDVELRVGGERYCFNADAPQFVTMQPGGRQSEFSSGEPLYLELENFIDNPGIEVKAVDVVKMVCEIEKR